MKLTSSLYATKSNSLPLILRGSMKSRLAFLALAGGIAAGASHGHAADSGWNVAAAGTFPYMDTANWVGGNINGLWDGSLTITGNQFATFDADTALTTGLDFRYDGGFNVTLRGNGGDRALTLGGDINVNTVSTTRTITLGVTTAGQALNVDLGGVTRTFTVGSGRSLGFVNVISNGGVVVNGGTVNYSGANTYSGATTVNSGNLSLNGGAGSAAASDISVRAIAGSTTTLTFNNGTSGNAGTNRAKNVALFGAVNSGGVALNVTGNSTVNTVDTITNALTAANGFSTVTVTANGSRNLRLEAGSFVRVPGSTILFRGSDLGVSSIASQNAGDANIFFGSVALSGGAGTAGHTDIGIIKGAYGDATAGGSGTGLVTHDAANGLRVLDTTSEYKASISDGQSQLDNVRFARAIGEAAIDQNLTAATTTINSLSFRVSGASTGAGVTLSGDAGTTLKIASGMIFASQTVTGPTSADAMRISVPTLDLNGQEGVFLSFTAGVTNGNTSAPLQINSSITNDGGNGVTIGGTGQIIFGGSTAHTYTGVTTINSGILRLAKTGGAPGIPGDLVMNGGTLLKNTNSIPDTASLTLNGGQFWLDTTTSSGNNNNAETILNLTLNGGSILHHGSNNAFTVNGDAVLLKGDLTSNQGGDISVLGTTTLNGGRLIARESSSAASQNGITNINNLAVLNSASGAYTPLILNAHSTNLGARLNLSGDVTFTGNAMNSNTVTFGSSDTALANQGNIALAGTRTFDIGNGAADVDLTIVPALTNNGVTVGGLSKNGAGTLAVLGANAYTGPTNVNAGNLLVGGTLNGTSLVTVLSGATISTDAAATIAPALDGSVVLDGVLAPGGVGANGVLTVELSGAGKLDFGGGATLALDLAVLPANADRVHFGIAGDWLDGSGLASLTLGGSVDYGAIYTLFENVSTSGFAFSAITGYDTLNYSAQVAQVGNDYQLSFQAIPEPALGGMLLGGLAALTGARRLRGRQAASNSSSNSI